MLFECSEVHQIAFQSEGRYLIADSFFSAWRRLPDCRTNFLQNRLNTAREAADIFINAPGCCRISAHIIPCLRNSLGDPRLDMSRIFSCQPHAPVGRYWYLVAKAMYANLGKATDAASLYPRMVGSISSHTLRSSLACADCTTWQKACTDRAEQVAPNSTNHI